MAGEAVRTVIGNLTTAPELTLTPCGFAASRRAAFHRRKPKTGLPFNATTRSTTSHPTGSASSGNPTSSNCRTAADPRGPSRIRIPLRARQRPKRRDTLPQLRSLIQQH